MVNGQVEEGKKIFSLCFGLFLAIGAIVSLIPLNLNIVRNKSTKGISFITIYIGALNAFAATVNCIIENWNPISICPDYLDCSEIVVVLINFVGVFILYHITLSNVVIFFDGKVGRQWQLVKAVVAFHIFFVAGNIVISAILLKVDTPLGQTTLNYAGMMGIFSSLLVFVQWAPQIYRTFKLKSKGNFSILMMCIQAPGSWIVLFYLLVLERQNWTTAVSYLTAGVQQVILLAMLVYYETIYKKWQARKEMRMRKIQQQPIQEGSVQEGEEEQRPTVALSVAAGHDDEKQSLLSHHSSSAHVGNNYSTTVDVY